MARIRTIKPEFFTSEDIVSLSPLARLLFIASWCEADREGRMAWKPKTFKLRYFPADNCDIDALARELVACGVIIPYGDGLAYIPSFSKHQHLNPRESQSSLPSPSENPRVSDASLPVIDAQVGREGKGRERNEGKTHASVASDLMPDVEELVAKDFIKVRNAKKAPLTRTAVDGIRKEAGKAGISLQAAIEIALQRGWQSFKADWVSGGQLNGHSEPVRRRNEL